MAAGGADDDTPSAAAGRASAAAAAPDGAKSERGDVDLLEDAEAAEVVLWSTKECYVYKIPPRKSTASYRADEWNINKWAWEGAMRIVAKGDDCTIRLEDGKTGELFAQAPVRPDQPVPVEAVIDSSRFFVLRIEDVGPPLPATKGKGPAPASSRHAFIGLGFRERPQAYDFQAAVYDHVKYLNKKKEAEEMEHEYQSRPAVDYSLKKGQMLHLDIKTPALKSKSGSTSTSSGPGRPSAGATPADAPSPGMALAHSGDSGDGAAEATVGEGAVGSILRQTSGEHSETAGESRSFFLPPPPPPAAVVSPGGSTAAAAATGQVNAAATVATTVAVSQQVDDDFGDFQAAV